MTGPVGVGVGVGGGGGLIVGQRSCATEQGKPSEPGCDDGSESNEARMAFSSGSDSGMEFARYHNKMCTHAIPSLSLAALRHWDKLQEITRPPTSLFFFTDCSRPEPPSDCSHSHR